MKPLILAVSLLAIVGCTKRYSPPLQDCLYRCVGESVGVAAKARTTEMCWKIAETYCGKGKAKVWRLI